MTKIIDRIFIITIFLSFITVAILLVFAPQKPYNAVCFKSGNTWGYAIYKGKRLFILQPYIPCIAGKKTFNTKAQAMHVGSYVVAKLNRHEEPSLQNEDLEFLLNE